MEWLYENGSIIWHALSSAIILLIIVIIYVRINGLRSFAKMSSVDFVTTITIGSIIGATIMTDTNSILKGTISIGILLFLQSIISILKIKMDWFSNIVENKPLLLMKDGEFLSSNLRKSNVSKSDVIAKLREANAIELSKVHAVILETTGDISVLHGDKKPDPKCILYDDVIY